MSIGAWLPDPDPDCKNMNRVQCDPRCIECGPRYPGYVPPCLLNEPFPDDCPAKERALGKPISIKEAIEQCDSLRLQREEERRKAREAEYEHEYKHGFAQESQEEVDNIKKDLEYYKDIVFTIEDIIVNFIEDHSEEEILQEIIKLLDKKKVEKYG